MQLSSSLVAFATALLSARAVTAHMKIAHPIPFSAATLSNAPLAADGSDFPCKMLYDEPTPDVLAQNTMSIGAPQTLSFMGSAVHGGGSCQISITSDLKPTKASVWKVIHSIEGGCPANTDGNLPADPNGSGASTFQFNIPAGFAPGRYTLAWIWFNRIGNREMYMNCAPIVVQGAAKKRYTPSERADPASLISLSKREDLPDLFVANFLPSWSSRVEILPRKTWCAGFSDFFPFSIYPSFVNICSRFYHHLFRYLD